MCTAIAVGVGRAATFEDLDDLEGRVGGRFLVLGHSDLAGAAAVRGRAFKAE